MKKLQAVAWGACLFLILGPQPALSAEQIALLGPADFVRTKGAPNSYVSTFSLPSQIAPPYVIRIANGRGRSDSRVSSASVSLNGVPVAGPADFSQNVAQFERTVSLRSSNTLEVRLSSVPASMLTVTVLGTRVAPVPTAIAPNPLTLTAGASGNLTATLSPVPQSAGSLGASSSDPAVATVPAGVGFTSGQATVTIPVAGIGPGTATVTASLNGKDAATTVQVSPRPAALTGLAPTSLAITQGATGSLTANVSPAAASDTPIVMSASDAGIVHVPASVTLPAGQTAVQVPVTALYPGLAEVAASLNGNRVTSHITVTPAAPKVVSLLPATGTVTYGATASLELTLSSAAKTPTTVALAASPANIVSLPASVNVPAGQVKTTVPVTAIGFGQASVVANLSGSSATAVLQVIPATPQVTSLLPSPFTLTAGAVGQFTVTLNAVQPADTDIALAVDRADLLQVPASVTVPQGATSAVFTAVGVAPGNAVVGASTNGSRQTALVYVSPQPAAVASLLPNPMPLQQGATGSLSAAINVAQESETALSIVNGAPSVVQAPASVVIPMGQVNAAIPVTGLEPGAALLTVSVNGTSASALVDVTLPPPRVTGIEPLVRTLPKGTPGTLRVTVSRAPNEPVSVQLVSDNPAIASVPASVTVPAGALYAEFPVSAWAEGQARVTASLNGGSGSTTITVAPPELAALTISPQTPVAYTGVTLAFAASGTLTDNSVRDFTQQVTWTSSNTGVATVSANGTAMTLAPGATTITAAYTFNDSQGVSRTVSQTTPLTIKAPGTLSFATAATTLQVGQSLLITLTSSDLAGPQGLIVELVGTGGVSVPASVLIPANQSSVTFNVVGVSEGNASVTASATGRTAAILTLNVQPPFAITGMEPASGPVGTPVTITGRNFDPDPAKNDVRFNGERAVVATASLTELRVIVPIKATTGPVTVTTARGTVTSAVPFTIQPLQGFDFQLSPASLQIPRGGMATVRARLVNLGLSPYSHGVALQVSGLPAGITERREPAQLSSGADTIVTLAADATVAPGTYTVTIAGTGPLDVGTAVRTHTLTLTVLAADTTTVSGRVVHAEDDRPFVGARIRLGNQQAVTDETGAYRFVTPSVLGDQVILVDGHTANTATTQYPSAIAVPVMIVAGQDNRALTSYIQAVDVTKFQAIVPGQATSVTSPDLPNYALNIPQGAVLMGWDGTPVTKVNVRAVPVDRLPIKPVPAGVNVKTVYLYYFFREGGANPSTPIPVTMANDMGALPGEKADLWYYDESITPDPNSNQWRIMGQGTVSADGLSIVSDPGVGIPKFCCGASFASPPPPPVPPTPTPDANPQPDAPPDSGPEPTPDSGTEPGPDPGCGDDPASSNPVVYGTGVALVMQDHSLGINGLVPVQLGCRYNSRTDRIGPFGRGTWLNTEWQVAPGSLALTLMGPAGHRYNLVKGTDGVYRTGPGPAGADGVEATVEGGLTVVRFPGGNRFEFASFGRGNQGLVAQIDKNGNRVTLNRTNSGMQQGLLLSVTDANGRVYRLEYTGSLISKITDPVGRSLSFAYDGNSRLVQVTDPLGNKTSYAYDAAHRIIRKVNARGAETRYEYDAEGRAVKEIFADGATYTFDYLVVGNQIMETRVTDPKGNVSVYRFNGLGNLVRATDPLGRIRQQGLDFSTNRLLSKTDPLGRITRYTYDERGNRTSVKDVQGNFTLIDYDPLFNLPTTVTSALGIRTIRNYDSHGNVSSVIDGEGQTTRFTYTAQGRLQTVTDPLGRITAYAYDREGNLSEVTDPLGNVTEMAYDSANRLASTTTPRGLTARTDYDSLDRITLATNPLGGQTKFQYDAVGNLLSVTDPLGHVLETNVYDLRNRRIERTDAAGKTTRFRYDLNGNLIERIDRDGRVTVFEYDAINRLVKRTDADGRSTRYAYDLAGKPSRISDSESGEMLFTYDELNRLTRTATDQGTVGYEYDVLGRLVRRTVNGADPTAYTYDKANRVKTITFRGRTAAYAYDGAGRLLSKTLPNGMVQAYGWDDGDRLIGIEYRRADGTVVETLTYAYDADGQRIQKGSGSDSLRETGFTAQYDTANRLTRITLDPGSAAEKTYRLDYDVSGNLVAKTNLADPADTTTYTWDARNRLTRLQGPGLQASFKYDALGRRVERTVNGEVTGYLYDGDQAIAELKGSAVAAAYHTGLALDEVLARYGAAGSRSLLQDALGSVIAQAKEDGSIQNWYAYTPYGQTQAVGPDEGNPLQYTGRENEGTGLYYYRARYYDPLLKRFISEDPIGLLGGINVYGYVGGDPLSRTDPTGQYWKFVQTVIVACGRIITRVARIWVKEETPPASPPTQAPPSPPSQSPWNLPTRAEREASQRAGEVPAAEAVKLRQEGYVPMNEIPGGTPYTPHPSGNGWVSPVGGTGWGSNPGGGWR